MQDLSFPLSIISSGIEKIQKLVVVECDILTSGKNFHSMKYYYCECDPYQKNSICEECKNKCHKGHITSEAKSGDKFCHCGLKGHVNEERSSEISGYSSQCFFYQFLRKSKALFYYYNRTKKIAFCAFCYSFCDNYVKISESEKVIVDHPKSILKCMCQNGLHTDLKNVYKKLNGITSFHQEELSYQHFINLFFLCKKLFKNLYSSLETKMNSLKINVLKDNFSFEENFEFSYYNWGLSNISNFLKNSKFIYFFNDHIKEFFLPKFVTKLLRSSLDKDRISTINFKENCMIGLYKCIIRENFMKLPSIRVEDLENLTPFQRLLLSDTANEEQSICEMFLTNKVGLNTKNSFNIIDELLDYLDKVSCLPSNNVINNVPIILLSIKIIYIFATYNFLDTTQKISFCKTIEILISKHLIKDVEEIQGSIMIFLKYLLNILLLFCLNKNDDLFYQRIICDDLNNSNEDFFHGKSELSKEISKLAILLGNQLTKLTSEKMSKVLKLLIQKNNKLLSLFLNYPDTYLYGLKKAVNQNTELYVNLLKKPQNINQNQKNIISFMKNESEKLLRLYKEYFLFKIKIDEVYTAVESSISYLFQYLRFSDYMKKNNNISSIDIFNSEGNTDKCFLEKDNKQNEDMRKNTEYILMESLKKNETVMKFEEFASNNQILMKSSYIFVIFDLLKINIKQNGLIEQEYRLPLRTFDSIIKLLTFFTDNSPDNCIILMGRNFIKFMIFYTPFHFESIFKLYYEALKQIINPNYEFPNIENIFNLIDEFIRVIKLDHYKYPYLNKILKIYDMIINNFSIFTEKFIKIIRKKMIKIHVEFPFIKDFIFYLVSNINTRKPDFHLDKENEENFRQKKQLFNKRKAIDRNSLAVYASGFSERNKIKVSQVEKIFGKYIKTLIDVFDDTGTCKHKEFLDNFIKLEYITIILCNYDLDLYFRSQVLRYFRMLYIDISIDPSRIEISKKRFNITEVSNNKKKKSYEDKIEEIYEFLGKLIHVPDLQENFDLEYTILKNEILNLDAIIQKVYKSKTINSFDKLLYYLENGVLLPIKVFYNKFLILIREKKNTVMNKQDSYLLNLKIDNSKISDTPIKNNLIPCVSPINTEFQEKKIAFQEELKSMEETNKHIEENKATPSTIDNLNYIKLKSKEQFSMERLTLKENLLENKLINIENNFIVDEKEENNDPDSERFDDYDRDKMGVKNIKFYEITLFFLFLKKKILDLLKDEPILKKMEVNSNKDIDKKKISLHKILGYENENLDIFNIEEEEVINGMNMDFLNIHKDKTQLLLNFESLEQNLNKLNNDLEAIQDENFEIFDQIKLSTIFETHFENFIVSKKTKSLNYLFAKTDDDLTAKLKILEEKIIKDSSFYNEKRILKFILNYEIAKKRLEESSFIENLNEFNYNYDCSYRKLIIKNIFTFINNEKFLESNKKEILGYILKLLQYDTKNTQLQILSQKPQDLNEENLKSIQESVFIPQFIDEFIGNLLSIIYFCYNPSSSKLNYDYYYGTYILKVMKYYCEEHNVEFQTLFYKTEVGKINNIPFSFIDFLLMTLNKLILVSNWDLSYNDREGDLNYFKDIFETVVDFLIESIQGSSKENLKSFLSPNSKLIPFIKSVKSLLLYNKSDNKTIYEIKTSIFSLILALLEENNSPKKLAYDIALELFPKKIINIIKTILKKLYIRLKTNKLAYTDYKKVKFNKKRYTYFINKYFNEDGFADNYEFKLALNMYEFFKILSSKYQVKDALLISNIFEDCNDEDIEFLVEKEISIKKILGKIFPYFNQSRGKIKQNKNRIDKEKLSYIENYYVLKLFNEIIKTIKIKLGENEVCSVFFSINPLCNHISSSTMQEFIENVNRENRYTKLFDMMEYCEVFFNEIKFNIEREKISRINNAFKRINFYWIQVIFYCLSLVLNIILIIALTSHEIDVVSTGNHSYYKFIYAITIFQIICNFLIITIWFYTRYPLYYDIELKKYIEAKNLLKEKVNWIDKIWVSLYDSLIKKTEINTYIFMIMMGIIGIIRPYNNFCFGFQLLTIINLSDTLKNIVRAIVIRWSQLLASISFMGVVVYCYAIIGFYFLNEHFERSHEAEENLCQSLLQCVFTHYHFGLRKEIGIGEIIPMVSYSDQEKYYIKFFYVMIFYFLIIVMLLNMLFGIIIDSFAELREEAAKIDSDKKDVCFICGAKRDEIEKDGISFDKHTEEEHNYFNYIYYIIGLKLDDIHNLDKINTFSYELIHEKSISWIPDYKKKKEEDNFQNPNS